MKAGARITSPPRSFRRQNPNAPAAVAIDAEGDGLLNLGEYAFGRDPRARDNSALATASIVNVAGTDYAAITFTAGTRRSTLPGRSKRRAISARGSRSIFRSAAPRISAAVLSG